MRNMHPADELAMIRTDIRRLREREDYLRKGFLTMRLPTHGVDAIVTVKILKNKRFCRDKLPTHLLNDPEMWETQVVRHVVVDETRETRGHMPVPPVPDADFAVIERF